MTSTHDYSALNLVRFYRDVYSVVKQNRELERRIKETLGSSDSKSKQATQPSWTHLDDHLSYTRLGNTIVIAYDGNLVGELFGGLESATQRAQSGQKTYERTRSKHPAPANPSADELYSKMTVDGKSFSEVIKNPYLHRDLNRETVREVVKKGLQASRGNYKIVAQMFHAGSGKTSYKRFLNFLRKQDLQLPFKQFRK